MAYRIGENVSIPLGIELRATGKIVRGPYPAPEQMRRHQLEAYGVCVANMYDVDCGLGGEPVSIGAAYIRRTK